jgi:acetyltransferase-like isoleucine patch superfamily enzyme
MNIINILAAFINKILIFINRNLWRTFNKYKFKNLGKNSFIEQHIFLSRSSICLNENVFIHRNARIEGVETYENINYTPEIVLDDNCSIQQNVHITCAERIYIGKDTAIAANVTITDIHHPYDDINLPIEKQKLSVSPVHIGNECKIYNNVVILPGTQIGKHCTVGANSVVSGVIPDYCVVVGLPAKIIKRFNFDTGKWQKTDKQGNFI